MVRLPPPHQRLAQIDFNLIPDSQLVFAEEGEEEDSDSADDEDDDNAQEDGAKAEPGQEEDDAEGEDEDMEEVGVGQPEAAGREVDEDYDA